MRLRRRRVQRLIGAMCPVCRTVQDWSGAHIYAAQILCSGPSGRRHGSAVVRPVVGEVAR